MINRLVTLSFIDSNVVACLLALVNLTRAHNLVMWILNKLVPVREPAGEARECKHDSKVLRWNSDSFVDHA